MYRSIPLAGRGLSVAHVVATLRVGGAERFAVDLAIAQMRAGQQVTLVAMYGGGPLLEVARQAGLEPRVIARRIKHDVLAWLRLVRLFRELRPDIVHLHDVAPILRGTAAARLAGRRALVALRHDVRSLGRARDLLLRLAERWTASRVASSRAVAAYLAGTGWQPPIPIIYCGIDAARFGYREPASRVAPRLLTMGRLDTQKGHETLIDALARLVGRWPAVRLVIAGEGPLRARLEALIRRQGLADRVRFVGVVVASERLLEEADIFCFPSRWEPQGLALLEAQAAGVPVVASGVGGVLETVTDGVTGILVPPRDAAALAEGIDRVARDHELRVRLARQARARVGQWDVTAASAAYLPLYLDALSRIGPPVLAPG